MLENINVNMYLRKSLVLVFFTIFLLLCPIFSADESELIINSYNHIVELEEKDSFHEINVRFVKNSGLDYLYLYFPRRIENFNVLAEGKQINCDVETIGDFSRANCPIDEYPLYSEINMRLSFSSTSPILKSGNRIIFKYFFKVDFFTEEVNYIVKLPSGFRIPPERDPSFFITPSPSSVFFDGRKEVVSLAKSNVDEPFEVSIFMEPQVHIDRGTFWIVLFVFIMILVIGSILYYYWKKSKEEVTYHALVEAEEAVVNALKEAKGNVLWQKQIQIKTGVSKVKLSRILQSLEKRKVIKKEPWGRTNKIYLLK